MLFDLFASLLLILIAAGFSLLPLMWQGTLKDEEETEHA